MRRPLPLTSTVFVALLVAVASAAAGCGGDDDSKQSRASDTQTGTTRSGDGARERSGTGGGPSGGEQSADGEAGPRSAGGQSGAAVEVDRPVRKRSLQRYLAKRHRQAAWYGMIRRIGVDGTRVNVYLAISPDSDDEVPPVLACTSVLRYSTRVKQVRVYGTDDTRTPYRLLKECGAAAPSG